MTDQRYQLDMWSMKSPLVREIMRQYDMVDGHECEWVLNQGIIALAAEVERLEGLYRKAGGHCTVVGVTEGTNK